jgi:hypothetical protein
LSKREENEKGYTDGPIANRNYVNFDQYHTTLQPWLSKTLHLRSRRGGQARCENRDNLDDNNRIAMVETFQGSWFRLWGDKNAQVAKKRRKVAAAI